jgi:hypothetical protein
MRVSASDVERISLDYKDSKWADAYGNQFRYRAKTIRKKGGGGSAKWAYDVFLVVALTGSGQVTN